MSELDNLYADTSPTKQRGEAEKFRPARTSRFWLNIADFAFYGLLERRFKALHYIGYENFLNRDENYPTILYAPHSNWWDGIVGYTICNRLCHKEIRIMIEELNRFPILRRAGGYSVNKKSAQSAMESLKYSVRVLKDTKAVLYIFPQGVITPPNHRPMEFQSGLAFIAQKAVKEYGKVNIIPVSVQYEFLRDNRPEILVEIGENMLFSDEKADRKELSATLAKKLEELSDKHLKVISNADFEGYKTLFTQKLAWYRQWEQRLKRIKKKNRGN